jgi:hypothetical protein
MSGASEGPKVMPVSGPAAQTDLKSRMIENARSLPHLISMAREASPSFAAQLQPKALVASKTVWGTILLPLLTFVSAKYGLGWDDDTCTTIAGLVVAGCAVVFRWMTKGPIGGVVSAGPEASAIGKEIGK